MFEIKLQDPIDVATNPFQIILSLDPPPIGGDIFIIWNWEDNDIGA